MKITPSMNPAVPLVIERQRSEQPTTVEMRQRSAQPSPFTTVQTPAPPTSTTTPIAKRK